MVKKVMMMVLMTTTIAMQAQKTTNRIKLGNPYDAAITIPSEFSYGNIPMLTLYDYTDKNILVYNENLEQIKSIPLSNNLTFDYQLTYKDESRTIVSVNEISKTESSRYRSYLEFLEHERIVNPTFDESQLIINKQENGDSIISFDYVRENYVNNAQMYFNYAYFGMKYPKVCLVCHGGEATMYRVSYSIAYSDWTETGTHTENKQQSLNRIRLCNVNINKGDGRPDCYFEVSQTLFNSDEEFEYIIPKLKLSDKGSLPSEYNLPIFNFPSDDDAPVEIVRSTVNSEQKKIALAGFQVVSADGGILNDITCDGDFEGSIDIDYGYVITMGQSTYLAFNGYDTKNNGQTIFYNIDRESTTIKKVKTADAKMILSPAILERNTPVCVSFTDDNAVGSDLKVVTSSGAVIQSVAVPKGQKNIQLNVNAPKGMYFISRFQKNKADETKKMIVK